MQSTPASVHLQDQAAALAEIQRQARADASLAAMARPQPLPADREQPASRAGRRAVDSLAADADNDWDVLFTAVLARLHGLMATTPMEQLDAALADCLQALDGLKVLHTQRRGSDIEGELLRKDRALVETRAELQAARQGERRAQHQARHDSLTLLPNRSGFSEHLDGALRCAERTAPALAVLYLDLDGFKPINDRHGHDTGDELLRVVAQRLSRSVRKQDLVCRLGGDEFACIVAAPLGREQLSQIASKLFDAVAAPLQVGGVQLSVRPSIGIAVCPSDGDNAVTLLKRADLAMYRAKRRQLGFAFFDRRADS